MKDLIDLIKVAIKYKNLKIPDQNNSDVPQHMYHPQNIVIASSPI